MGARRGWAAELHPVTAVYAAVAIPAAGLIAGSVLGLLLPALPTAVVVATLVGSAAAALGAWRASRARALAGAVAVGFMVGGFVLSADAWRAAWRPSLRIAFEELGACEDEAEREGDVRPKMTKRSRSSPGRSRRMRR